MLIRMTGFVFSGMDVAASDDLSSGPTFVATASMRGTLATTASGR
jgi:hypothetical protein